MLVQPLIIEEIVQQGITSLITHADLTETIANTDQTLTVKAIPEGQVVSKVAYQLIVPFEDESDVALNDTDFAVGDTSGVGTLLAAQQVNLNGTEIKTAHDNTGKSFPAANTLEVTFGSMAAKSLVNIDKGELLLFVWFTDAKGMADKAATTVVA